MPGTRRTKRRYWSIIDNIEEGNLIDTEKPLLEIPTRATVNSLSDGHPAKAPISNIPSN